MYIDSIVDLLQHGHEVEFIYNDKRYSITQGIIEGKHVYSFCEFNKESSEFDTIDGLLSAKRNNNSLKNMLNELSDENVWIY